MSASNWVTNAYEQGLLLQHRTLAARVLSGLFEGGYLLNVPRPHGDCLIAMFPGTGGWDFYSVPRLEEGNFPYGWDVEPPG